MTARDRLILALDLPSLEATEGMLKRLQGKIHLFKVGLELFTAEGPRVITRIHDRGGKVFLDLKLHDIPQTVAAAVAKAVQWGVFMLDVHVAGGEEMMRAAAHAAADRAEAIGIERPRLLGVTVLTSLAQADLQTLGIGQALEEQVLSLARLAKEAGLDGVVASPREAEAIRRRLGPDLLLVTPGIRSRVGEPDDQRRVATARDALKAGADYIVVGRPILKAADPVEAVEKLVAEMETP
ncbi:MAG: orotidine-5'-phosphate decarboxylase [candidate division NC10 bacterium]|jgi:orotidine-5'-phosphate decarboxylase|nr:orotidine-5'-phosphate decarboxylase [candidate division NC10 bacterium]MCZ6551377.1 orotidine-5'-phosphate decarboxylase [candidate division NC10 bacterium]